LHDPGDRHRRGAGSSYSGTKISEAIWNLAGEGKVFEKEAATGRRFQDACIIVNIKNAS